MSRKRLKYRCSDCVHWIPNGSWQSSHNPNWLVIAEGTCENTGKTKLNCSYQCRDGFVHNDSRGQVFLRDFN